ncbi:unnamed protein product [Lactuca saligna]|uniref:DUF7026 domain-containing protein n=1 Tax=Lactuca saligna TaxID=75948 RepID=A0AA35ZM50_LACSI|nr:unnamed protein product [Lactuca saligna]
MGKGCNQSFSGRNKKSEIYEEERAKKREYEMKYMGKRGTQNPCSPFAHILHLIFSFLCPFFFINFALLVPSTETLIATLPHPLRSSPSDNASARDIASGSEALRLSLRRRLSSAPFFSSSDHVCNVTVVVIFASVFRCFVTLFRCFACAAFASDIFCRSRKLLYAELCLYLGLGKKELRRKWDRMEEDDKWVLAEEFVSN